MTGRLQEANVLLRAPEPEDLACMFRFENAIELWDVSNTTGPYSHFHLKQYIEQNQNDLFADRQLRLMIEDVPSKQATGIVDLFSFDPLHSRAEVGIVVAVEYRKQGIAFKALSLLEEHCFRRLGIHQLYAYIGAENTPSRKLFEACGYQESALLKEWMRTSKGFRDVLMVQKLNPFS